MYTCKHKYFKHLNIFSSAFLLCIGFSLMNDSFSSLFFILITYSCNKRLPPRNNRGRIYSFFPYLLFVLPPFCYCILLWRRSTFRDKHMHTHSQILLFFISLWVGICYNNNPLKKVTDVTCRYCICFESILNFCGVYRKRYKT